MILNISRKKLIPDSINLPMKGLATITSRKTNTIPNRSMASIPRRTKSGASAYRTREPSSGGIGNILKIKNPKFTMTATVSISPIGVVIGWPSSTSSPKDRKAMKKLVSGPARATNPAPHSSPFTRAGLNGTGFAPPKIGA